jgi:class 3 adenylate cyclase/ABC-type transport system involved in cytochrome c biogenesis ATPase subunit
MDVVSWLHGLGLEQYAPAFRDNDVDGEVLPELTSDDLISIGVTSVGHRRKLLGAIAALRRDAQRPIADTAPAAAVISGEAERRQLTVMFCDLVGSIPLSTRYDPEDLREIVGDYHRCVADTVGRFAGFVAKYMGDGVLVYFGYPEAHEDDAERAVRAGLAVIDAVGGLATPEPLNVRLGIASGLVVVGDLIGAGAAQERGVVGETPNLAARLQTLAHPGTLVIAESARRQIGALFEVEDLGPRLLAGFGEPQRAWRVLGESGVVSRFEALRSEATPLVGRDEEFDLLLRRWRQAKSGEGRVVLLSGEPGMGKSRLTAELSRCLASEPHTRLRYFCSPHHQDSALHPFITQLGHAAKLARADTAEEKLDKLRALVAPAAQGNDEVELLAELLSLPNSAAKLNVGPQRKREMLFAALLHQLEGLAARQPVLFLCEDLHWIDPSSRELFDRMIERAASLPVLLIATHRPEFEPPWTGLPQVTTISLARLDQRASASMVERIAGNTGLASDLVEEIVAPRRRRATLRRRAHQSRARRGRLRHNGREDAGGRAAVNGGGALGIARPTDGAARPPRPGPERGCPDRRRDRTRVFLSIIGAGRRPQRQRSLRGARPARRGRPRLRAWHPARSGLPVQACSGARRGLCQPAATPPRGAACADRRCARK